MWARDNFTCRRCGAHDRLQVDHIVPRSGGGAYSMDNYQTLCRSCNASKGGVKDGPTVEGYQRRIPKLPATTFYLTREQLNALRSLAGDLGIMQTRGPSAGREGSISALLGSVADAYAADPDAIRAALSELLPTR